MPSDIEIARAAKLEPVSAIAERAGVRMPSFAAYVWKYALPGLLPGLLLVWWWFFRD